MNYVVGSGPAGISCAAALIEAGQKVTILDSGLELERDRLDSTRTLSASPAGDWTPAATAFLREGISSGAAGIPLKLAYGSNYPYRQVAGSTVIECSGADTKPSYARGGLSTVWGSAVLPYRQADLNGWPISVEDLEPGYRAVLQWMPLSAREDALAIFFPLYTADFASLPSSSQAKSVYSDFERHQAKLSRRGIYFGSSRLAVTANARNAKPPCAQCGLCMYGCPHSLIYSSDQTLPSLLASGRLRYQPGITVQSLQERPDGVLILAVDRDGKETRFEADRVFLGAGVLNTTAILLRSLGRYDTPVQIRDSQYFLLPLLRLRGTRGVLREPLHTLAQMFVEIFDTAISPYTVHLQMYTYNDLFRDPLLAALGPFKAFFPMEAFLGRLLLFQGYLHSAHSAAIFATLQRKNGGDSLALTSTPNRETRPRLRRLIRKLALAAGSTGLLPLSPMLQVGKPGRGFHSGGSFPMRSQPGAQDSDILGRPAGLSRIHAIDSTVLPSIPATTITYTVMANAYRIGALVARNAPAMPWR